MPGAQSPPLRRSTRTAATSTTSNPSNRDLHRQITELNAEKQALLNELARHEKQTEALKKDNAAKEERLRQVGEFLKVLERMDRVQAEEEGWDFAVDGEEEMGSERRGYGNKAKGKR